jgi:hypothetical protein
MFAHRRAVSVNPRIRRMVSQFEAATAIVDGSPAVLIRES